LFLANFQLEVGLSVGHTLKNWFLRISSWTLDIQLEIRKISFFGEFQAGGWTFRWTYTEKLVSANIQLDVGYSVGDKIIRFRLISSWMLNL
jgi:hypothetical protein